MNVIIIAAGKGKRISNKFKDIPKSLIPVNGQTIFERQKNAFQYNKNCKFIVITGSENKFKDLDAKYIQDNENEKHDILGSLMLAKDHINGETIISYSDIIFEKKIIEQLYKTEGDMVIAVDLNWKKEYIGRTEHPILEAENVLLDENNKILQIKKNIVNKDGIVGEFLGLMKMTETGSKIFLEKINQLQKNHQGKFHNAQSLEKGYLTDMIQELIDSSIQITPMFISGKWCEIDTNQDLENAMKKFK